MLLKDKTCIPCRGGVPPLESNEKEEFLSLISPHWCLIDEGKKLKLSVLCHDFAMAIAISNEIAKLADEQWHHPQLVVNFGRLDIILWTHKIGDLVESDFILASKIDELLFNFSEVRFES